MFLFDFRQSDFDQVIAGYDTSVRDYFREARLGMLKENSLTNIAQKAEQEPAPLFGKLKGHDSLSRARWVSLAKRAYAMLRRNEPECSEHLSRIVFKMAALHRGEKWNASSPISPFRRTRCSCVKERDREKGPRVQEGEERY